MAKPLIFVHDGRELSFQMRKVDREKLYGSKEQLVKDEEDAPCELATLAGDGRTLVGRGGTGMGYLSPDGTWRERAGLRPVDLEGNEIPEVPSSFDAPIPLEELATIEDYLLHNVRAIYAMDCEDELGELAGELESGLIYRFPYNFRKGIESDAGFLLASDEGVVFLAVGTPTTIELLGLLQTAAATAEDEDADADEEEDIDFGMI